MPELSWCFRVLAAATAVGIPLYAWRIRGRTFAIFGAVLLAFSLPGALLIHAHLLGWLPEPGGLWLNLVFTGLIATTGAQLAHLVEARMRGRVFRWCVSIPGQAFLAMGFLSGVWLLALLPIRLLVAALGWTGAESALDWLDFVPLALCVASIGTSLSPVHEVVRVRLGRRGPAKLQRVPVERHRGRSPRPLEEKVLRIVQIADPHLGPWQSVAQLQRTLRALLQRKPDLIALTGDFLTMEGRGTPDALLEALRPLEEHPGRCFAIFGNHDHESTELVSEALEANGVELLVDAERIVDTPIGPLQLLGADYRGRGREAHIQGLLAKYPRRADHLRLLLLHDPLTFHHVPAGDVDLTLSGHTHGGQLGLVSLGLDWTVLSRSRWPDHGLFAHGSGRLYVHRGIGFYGFPLRVGVPGEASMLEVVPA
jgi:predicted MPP superfamily phosphohydrolase